MEVEKIRAMNLDPKWLRLFISKSNKTRKWWYERWVSSALVLHFCACFRGLWKEKAPPFLDTHWIAIPFSFAPVYVDSELFWPSADLLPYVSSLTLSGKHSTTLEITDLCGREKWELDIPDTLMSPCSGYDIIKALSNEKMQYSAQATEQHCISSRGHGSLVASGKRSTCCHKVTEK